MAINPVLLKLVEQSAKKYTPETYLKHKVRRQVCCHHGKVAEERAGWFDRRFLPPTSVLARLPLYDREALIAHFHAKEMRAVADAMDSNDLHKAALARKRLERVNEVATAFSGTNSGNRQAA